MKLSTQHVLQLHQRLHEQHKACRACSMLTTWLSCKRGNANEMFFIILQRKGRPACLLMIIYVARTSCRLACGKFTSFQYCSGETRLALPVPGSSPTRKRYKKLCHHHHHHRSNDVFCKQAAIFGAPAAQMPAEDEPLSSPARAASSDSDERPQVVELHEITAFGDDVSKRNISKSSARQCLHSYGIQCRC